jgi:hypothetical protein
MPMPTLSRRIISGMIIGIIITGSLALGLYFLPARASNLEGSTTDSHGLKLSVVVNTTLMKSGQRIQVSVSLYNTLDVKNNLSISDNLPFRGVLLALWPTCTYIVGLNYDTTPAQAIILKGNFTAATIPSVANASLWSGVGILCHEGVEAHNVIFEPHSSMANVTGICYCPLGTSIGPFEISNNFTTRGYWDPSLNSHRSTPPFLAWGPNNQDSNQVPTETIFVPGVYTVAVGDVWGQEVVLHFTVSA